MPKSVLQRWQDLIASKDGPAKHTERLVALVLSLHMRPHGGGAWPSEVLLAERTNLCERTVRDALHALERDSWLIRSKPGRNYSYQARIPAMLIPATDAGIEDRIPATDSTTPATDSKNTGTTCRLTDQEQTKNRERTTLPPDFEITRKSREWAEQELNPSIDVEHATKKFREYHQAESSTRVDWQAAWRKWMLHEHLPQANGKSNGGRMSPAKADYWALKFSMIRRHGEPEDEFIARVQERLQQHGGTV